MEVPITAKAAVLQTLLALTRESYGLDLIERIAVLSSGRIILKQGSVYPALRGLERAKLVESRREGARPKGGRPRRFYKLTEKGVEVAVAQRSVVASVFGLSL